MEATQPQTKSWRKWLDKVPTMATLFEFIFGVIGIYLIPFVALHARDLETTMPWGKIYTGNHVWAFLALFAALYSVFAGLTLLLKTTKYFETSMAKITKNKKSAWWLSSIPYYGYLGYVIYLAVQAY